MSLTIGLGGLKFDRSKFDTRVVGGKNAGADLKNARCLGICRRCNGNSSLGELTELWAWEYEEKSYTYLWQFLSLEIRRQ